MPELSPPSSPAETAPREEPPAYEPPTADVLQQIQAEQSQASESIAFMHALSGRRERQGPVHAEPVVLESDTESDVSDGLYSAHSHRADSEESIRGMEEFDMLDPEPERGPSFTSRASLASQRLARSVSNKIISPVSRMLDPVAQLLSGLSRRFDVVIAKFGNPLILKRLLYLFFVFLIIYVSFESGLLPGSKRDGFGGGYNDRKSLLEFVRQAVRPDLIKERVEYLSSMPHQAGTAGDLTLAKYIEEQLKLYGLSPVEMAEHQAFISYPNETADSTTLELLDGDKVVYKANMLEDLVYPDDAHKQQPRPYVAFSQPGTAEGPLVFANYGTRADFAFLGEHGVDVRDCIVLVARGPLELGLVAKTAQEAGVRGLVTISDYTTGVYPDGAVERGADVVPVVPGDVLTPGWSSVGGHRVTEKPGSGTVPVLPIVPLAWRDARRFLEAVQGHGVEVNEWAKHNGFGKWWSGDGKSVRVRLVNGIVEKDRHAVWNVFGKLAGVEQGELAVILGARRDSFCYGAVESGTGTAVLLELARVLSTMSSKLGWVPLRSIYFASWDASNHNWAGSTEWVEYNANELRKNGAVYISLDEVVSGQDFVAQGHPIFSKAVAEVVREVRDPATNETVFGRWMSKGGQIDPFDQPGDYLGFQSFAGIASLAVGFRGSGYPRHSCFDSFEWMEAHGDGPEFEYHGAAVDVLSRLVLKLADDPIMPMDVRSYVDALDRYQKDLERYVESLGGKLNFGALGGAIGKLRYMGDKFSSWESGWSNTVESGGEPSVFSVHRWSWNTHLVGLDKHLLDSAGVPGREWFKHVVFGPQMWHPTEGGYLWGTFPAIRDLAERRDWKGAQAMVERVAKVVLAGAGRLGG